MSTIALLLLIGLGIALIGMIINFRLNSQRSRRPPRLTLDDVLFGGRRRNKR